MKKLKSIKGIPLSYIKSVIKIDPTSPSGLTWLPRKNVRFNSYCANKAAGNIDTHTKGYQSWKTLISYNGKKYRLKCSRIIFLLHKGYLEKDNIIDHIDNNSLNNKIENLRKCTISQNCHNSKMPKNNTSGHKGVHLHKLSGKWRVQMKLNGKYHCFGLYVNKEDAIKVAIAARKKLHGDFGRDE
jgi:hypothetical protein